MPSFQTIALLALVAGACWGAAHYFGAQIAVKTHQLLTWVAGGIHPAAAKVVAPVAIVPSTPAVLDGVLSTDGTHTKEATPTNAFAGYVSPDGGTFGGGTSPDVASARKSFEAVSGVSADKLGLSATATAADYDAMTKLFGGIASRVPEAIARGLTSSNPYVRQVALAYANGTG